MCLPNILSPVFMFAFIFHCRSFSPCWPLAFLIVSQPLWIFMFFFLQNSSLLFSITRSNSLSQITSKKIPLCCCFFFLIVRAAMRFLSKWNLELHFGCHTCWLNYFTLVCLWCGRTVGRAGGRCTVTWLPIFLGWIVYHISLPMVLRCARSRTRAPLLNQRRSISINQSFSYALCFQGASLSI